MTSYPTGWLADPPATQPELLLGAGYLRDLLEHSPSSGSLLPRPHWRQIQREESCTGRAGVGVAYEHSGEKGSAECLWYWARRRDQGPNVQDTGVTIASMRWAYQEFGACSADAWNPTVNGYAIVGENAKPPALAVLKTRKLDIAPLYGPGHELVQAVAVALDLGLPVLFVVGAGGQFNEERNGTVGPRKESRRANHIVYARGHRSRQTGRREFRTANTWLGWGDSEGCAWVDEDWIASSEYVAVCRRVS